MRLELRDVWAGPPGASDAVLRGSSLGVRGGEWVAVEGPNGCGKTTLLLVAAGLRPLARGTRSLEGGADGGSPPRVATILQDPSVQLFQPTVAEEIALTALHLGLDRGRTDAEVRRWSDRLGLSDELGRDPHTLSAGRQQLVLVAAALAIAPDLLVADEPGAHLDGPSRERVLDAVREEVRRGMGVLWATQDPAERAAADRVVRLGAEGDAGVPLRKAAGAEAIEGGALLLRLGVAAWSAAAGPCVRVPQAFEITLRERGLTALAGPNGAGKSVLLACATGIADCPQVTRQWADHASPPLLVAQYPELQVFEDVVENELAFAATRRGLERNEALARASSLLERLGLGGRRFLTRRTWELSAGEKRLALTVAGLIAPAGLLALDEPTAGLDRERRAALAGCVRDRAAAGAVLIASQDLDWVAAAGARLVRLPIGQGLPSLSKKTD